MTPNDDATVGINLDYLDDRAREAYQEVHTRALEVLVMVGVR